MKMISEYFHKETKMSLTTIDADLLAHIFSFLGAKQYLPLALVAKEIRWHLRKRKYEQITLVESCLLRWAVDTTDFLITSQTLYRLAREGDLELLKWAYECPRRAIVWAFFAEKYMAIDAARGGHVSVLEWAVRLPMYYKTSTEAGWNERLYEAAATGGHINVLEWLNNNICTYHIRTHVHAARAGQLETLEWLHGRYTMSRDSEACNSAAQGGHIHVLEWLRFQKFPWDELACICAACAGQLEALKWLREKGCPWDGRTLIRAMECKQWEVFKWARENRCEGWDNERILREANQLGFYSK